MYLSGEYPGGQKIVRDDERRGTCAKGREGEI